eukprot:g8126.t1
MARLTEELQIHWRRQRLLCNGESLEEHARWSDITQDETVDILLLHCDHRHREPIVDREKMLAMVRGSADSLAFASEDLKNDREVVTVAVMQWGEALQYASRSLQKDPEILRLAMAKDPRAFCRAGKILRKDQTFATWAVHFDPDMMRFVHEELLKNKDLPRRDEDFMKHHVQRCASLIRYSTARLDKETVLGAMEQDGLALEFVNRPPNRYAQDADVVRAAVRQNGLALRFASEVLREDVQMVREALESDERALKFVSSKDLAALHMISKHGNVLELLKPSLRRDERVLAAVAEFASGGACRRVFCTPEVLSLVTFGAFVNVYPSWGDKTPVVGLLHKKEFAADFAQDPEKAIRGGRIKVRKLSLNSRGELKVTMKQP